MDNKTELEAILQNAVDELFLLQNQSKADHQKFITAAAVLLKESRKQVEDSQQAVSRAEKAASDSEAFIQTASTLARDSSEGLRFWHRAVFWSAVGYVLTGICLALICFTFGREIESDQRAVDRLQQQYEELTSQIKHNSASTKL